MSVALNPAQRAAVEHHAGPLLVLAGAGSGKTRVLTARLAHLVEHHRLPPHRILAVTFTNKAAAEMRTRIATLLGREPSGLWIGTFHSLAARMLRREAEHLGFTRQFSIYDEDDRMAVIKRLLERGGYSPKQYPPRLVQSIISGAKNRLVTADELAADARDPLTRVSAEVYHGLNAALLQQNAMDFDDLLLLPLTLFRQRPDRLDFYRQRFASVLVDEFQDTNRAQYLFVKQLAEQHRALCVVGDDDQAIYGWRGADVRNMLDFKKDFPDATMVRLEENYRSTPTILSAANGVIAENADRLGKTLHATRPAGPAVTVLTVADERDEAEWIARELRERSAVDHYAWADMAVLYRTNSQSRALEEVFRRVALPHRVIGAISFYERREVKDLMAYLRLIVNPADNDAFLRAVQVPKRGLGLHSVATLQTAAAQWGQPMLAVAATSNRVPDLRPQAKQAFIEFAHLISSLAVHVPTSTPAGLLERVLEATDYESFLAAEGPEGVERVENVRELLASAAEWSEEAEEDDPATPLERFMATAALATPSENASGDPEGVRLMTVHTAKGLEWPLVVVAGLEDGLFPLSRSLETPGGVEEERRLAYVAITRARDRLYLTWARARRRNGQLMPSMASRFLEALPPDVIEERRSSGVFGGDVVRRTPRASSMPWPGVMEPSSEPERESQDAPRFVKGERVRHRHFGAGTIRGLAGHGRDLKVVVEFDDSDVGTKNLLVAYAGLERDWETA